MKQQPLLIRTNYNATKNTEHQQFFLLLPPFVKSLFRLQLTIISCQTQRHVLFKYHHSMWSTEAFQYAAAADDDDDAVEMLEKYIKMIRYSSVYHRRRRCVVVVYQFVTELQQKTSSESHSEFFQDLFKLFHTKHLFLSFLLANLNQLPSEICQIMQLRCYPDILSLCYVSIKLRFFLSCRC